MTPCNRSFGLRFWQVTGISFLSFVSFNGTRPTQEMMQFLKLDKSANNGQALNSRSAVARQLSCLVQRQLSCLVDAEFFTTVFA